jgi:WXG100 family type VII secretion target
MRMKDVIQVDYDQMEQIAGRFARQAEDAAQMRRRVYNAFQKLEAGAWEGRGADAFIKEMETFIFPALNRLEQAMSQAAEVCRQINQVVQQAEEEAGSLFRDGAGGGPTGGGGGAGAGAGGAGFSGGRYGTQVGSGIFPGNPFNGAGMAAGGNFGVPSDWLGGVNDWLSNFYQGNYNDNGIPKDWLGGVNEWMGDLTGAEGQAAAEAGQAAPASGGGSGGGGGGQSEPQTEAQSQSGGGGSGSGGGGSPSEQSQTASPSGSSTAGRSNIPTDINSPYRGTGLRSGGGFGGSFGGGGGEGIQTGAGAARAGGMQYQPGGGGFGGAQASAGVPSPTGGGGGGMAAPATQGGGPAMWGSLPVGLGLATPFLALFGKAVKDQLSND